MSHIFIIMTQLLTGPVLISDFDWTLDRYHQAIKNGTFGPDDKLELLHGKLIKKMSINPPHASCLKKISKYFYRRFLDQYELMAENPVTLVNASEPEPDFSIVTLKEDNYKDAHPQAQDVFLLVEVADKSLQRDRTHKARIYAESNIPEYWIINLPEERIEVHLVPDVETGVYQSVNQYKRFSSFNSPLVGEVKVEDLLP